MTDCRSKDEGSLYFLGVIGGKFNETMIDLIKEKKRFRIVGDNINWYEGVHDQRKDHTSHMVHAFGSAILVQNVAFSSVTDVYPQRNFTETPIQEFIPSTDDYKLYYIPITDTTLELSVFWPSDTESRINELRFSESISLSFKTRLTSVTCFCGDVT